jgi:hypothetical protein
MSTANSSSGDDFPRADRILDLYLRERSQQNLKKKSYPDYMPHRTYHHHIKRTLCWMTNTGSRSLDPVPLRCRLHLFIPGRPCGEQGRRATQQDPCRPTKQEIITYFFSPVKDACNVNSRPIIGKGCHRMKQHALPHSPEAPPLFLCSLFFSFVPLIFQSQPARVRCPMWKAVAVSVRWCGKRATGRVQPAGICVTKLRQSGSHAS